MYEAVALSTGGGKVPVAPALVIGDPEWKKKPGSRWSRGERRSIDEPAPTVQASVGMYGTPVMLENAGNEPEYEPGTKLAPCLEEEWENVAPGKVSKKYMSLVKAREDRPSPTVTTKAATAAGVALTALG